MLYRLRAVFHNAMMASRAVMCDVLVVLGPQKRANDNILQADGERMQRLMPGHRKEFANR